MAHPAQASAHAKLAFAALVGLAACGRWGYEVGESCEGTRCLGDAGFPATEDDGGVILDGDGAPLPGPPACGSLQLLHESFDGATTNQYWFELSSGGGQAILADDRVELKLGAGSGNAEATYTANSSFDFRSSELTVRLERTGGRSSGVELRDGAGRDRFGALIGASHGVAFAVTDGQLEALLLDGTAQTVLASGSYDATSARYLRLREQAGTISWDTSADRVSWSTFHAQAVALDTSLVYPVLFARGQTAAASEAWFDDLDEPAASVPGFCAAASLSDDFRASSFAPAWRPWNGAGTCTVRETGGAAELSFPASFSACSLVTVALYDLRASAFAVELPAVPRDTSFQVLVELRTAAFGDRVELRLSGTSARLTLYQGNAVATQSSTSFDPSAAPFVRLREDAGTLCWDTSADGAAWSTPLSMSNSIDLSAVNLAVTGLQNGSTAQVLRIGSVNPP